MNKFKSAIEKFENVIISICAVFLAAITLMIVYQVVARRLGIPVSGTEELARYSYVIFVFMLWPIAARRGEDLRITVLFDLLPATARRYIMALFHVFMAVFSAVCIYSTYLNIQNDIQNTVILPSNTWLDLVWIHLVILIAVILTFLANIVRCVALIMGTEHVPTQAELTNTELAHEGINTSDDEKEGASA